MIRLLVIVAFLATLHNVASQDAKILPPIYQQPKCYSVQCHKKTDHRLNDLIDEVAKSCQCDDCVKHKVHLDLQSLCKGYVNYDPATNGLIQCVINKLTNPCYKQYYNHFLEILNKGCSKACHKSNFNIYTFLSDVCYSCNGCLDDCWIQNGQTIVYATPLASGDVAKATSVDDAAATPAAAAAPAAKAAPA